MYIISSSREGDNDNSVRNDESRRYYNDQDSNKQSSELNIRSRPSNVMLGSGDDYGSCCSEISPTEKSNHNHALQYIAENEPTANIFSKKTSFLTFFEENPEQFYQRSFQEDNNESSINIISARSLSTKSKVGNNSDSSNNEPIDELRSSATVQSFGTLADTDGLRRALGLRESIRNHEKKEAQTRESRLENIEQLMKNKLQGTPLERVKVQTDRKGYKDIPEYSRHTTALLFVDISGFTKLSTILDVETLSRTINEYFEIIVNEIIECGGDILKFAGDALFAEWPVVDMKKKLSKLEENLAWLRTGSFSVEKSVLCAALCGSNIVEKCSDFEVNVSNNAKENPTLNVHCGIGVGDVVALHVGCDDSKKEFLLLGDPIDQVCFIFIYIMKKIKAYHVTFRLPKQKKLHR